MVSDKENQYTANSDRISFRDIILRVRFWQQYMLSQWLVFLLFIFTAVILALVHAFFVKSINVAEISFVLDDSNTSTLAQYANLAALGGISMNSESNGLF